MENFRSKSCREDRMQIGSYYGGGRSAPPNMHDLRSYSTNSYVSSPHIMGKEVKMKKVKSSVGSSSSSKSWSFNDAELQRKKRVAGYKVYGVEGKMKGSLRKSFRWIKDTYTHVVYGWWD
ncbi:uncharacterized protein LOC132287120 [Cornus florida]|uniref:uncharacterized protein LOC132287120 n=1 Tax=Cornus florida TaxID=4283 RepID=UPI00289E80FA|nr:uncharacterized protein LOC132287120 [Cornus florida]